MSHTELHIGKLKELDLQGKTPEEWAKEFCIKLQNGSDELQEYDTYVKDLLYYHSYNHKELEDKYFVSGNRVFVNIEHSKEDDPSDIYHLQKNSDDTYSYIMQFYNGGSCLQECIEESLEKMIKNENRK